MRNSDLMRFGVSVSAGDIREALIQQDMGDFSNLADDAQFEIEVSIEQWEVDDGCSVCGGDGPEPQVSNRLINDFIAAINRGDLATARALVGRVFEDPTDIASVDNALCRCA